MATRTMNVSEFAAHIGVSQPYVSILKKKGRLVMVTENGKPRVDVAASMRLLEQTAHLTRGGKLNDRSKPTAATPEPDATAADRQTPKKSSDALDLFRNAQTRERVFVAKIKELEYLKEAGTLTSAAGVRSALGTVLVNTREALLQIPARLAPLLAAESDPAAIQNKLREAIHGALSELASARIPTALAAAGDRAAQAVETTA